MMKKIKIYLWPLVLFGFLSGNLLHSQEVSRWSVAFYSGFQYNFLTKKWHTIRRKDGYILPFRTPIGWEYSQKEPLGSTYGVELLYRRSPKVSVGISYTRTYNTGRYRGKISDGQVYFELRDFRLRDINNFYSAFLSYNIRAMNCCYVEFGWYYLVPQLSSVEVIGQNQFVLAEYSKKNANYEELGMYAGFRYNFWHGKHYEAGFRTRIMYTASTGEFELWEFTPYVKVHLGN